MDSIIIIIIIIKKPDANSLKLYCDIDAAHLHLYSDCFFLSHKLGA